MGTSRVLPSVFRGIQFRSRTEARWAIYFEALGVAWEYETEGYALPSGNYLPDFLLPPRTGVGARWVEIKGEPAKELDQRLARELADLTGLPVVIFVGPPITSRLEGQEWGPDGSYSEPVDIDVNDAASDYAAKVSANANWDRGGEAQVPEMRRPADPVPPDNGLAKRLRDRDLRFEWEHLIGAAIFRPELFPMVKADLPPSEIEDEILRSIWVAAIDVESVAGISAANVAANLCGDSKAMAALCALPDYIDGDTFERWVPDAIKNREARRERDKRLRAVLSVFAPDKKPKEGGA